MNGVTDSVDMTLSKLQETEEERGTWHAAIHGVTKSQTQLSNLTTMFSVNQHLKIIARIS